jgi:hypothetical protein
MTSQSNSTMLRVGRVYVIMNEDNNRPIKVFKNKLLAEHFISTRLWCWVEEVEME